MWMPSPFLCPGPPDGIWPLQIAVLGILLACLTNTLVKGLFFAFVAGYKDHFKLPLIMLAAMVPGCLTALVLL